jgi:tRNA(His) 5'-end guanylyltransferase
MPIIIRLDGCHFHTFTKGFNKPFDDMLMETMQETAMVLCREIEGVKLAYTQSDEISLLITNNDTWETQPWFGNNLSKMVSVAASIATLAFNRAWNNRCDEYCEYHAAWGMFESGYSPAEVVIATDNLVKAYERACNKGATFDARVFVLPADEVCNYFIWRQQDAIRNSIQSMGQAHFSHKELMNKNCENIKQMLVEKNLKWESIPVSCQRGICVIKKPTKVKTQIDMKAMTYMEMTRNRWTVDDNIPLFWEDRKYIDSLFNHGGENYMES